MDTWVQILILVGFFAIIIGALLQVRVRLIHLWNDVSNKEIVFHRLMRDTAIVFLEHKTLFDVIECQPTFKKIKRYNRQKIRYLLLQERRDMFSSLNSLYRSIEESDDETFNSLRSSFQNLQKARRLYNSKVLIYNQTITMFPLRYFAVKLNLKPKEYFG